MKTFLTTLATMAICSAATGADWPQFRGPRRDGRSQETGLAKTWPDGGPKLLWKVDGLGAGWAHPAVVGERIYTTGVIDKRHVVRCLDRTKQGKELWKADYGEAWTGRFTGSRCTPTVRDGKVYVISSRSLVSCFDAADGEKLWSRDVVKDFNGTIRRWGNAESPLLIGNTLIATPGGEDGAVVALNAGTGKTAWVCDDVTDLAGYCAPILATRGDASAVVTLLREHVVGIDPQNGALLWKHPYKNRYGNHCTSPLQVGELLYCTSGYGYGGVCLKLSDDLKSVEQLWKEPTPDTIHGGVVALDGRIYGSTQYGKTGGGKWARVNLATGKVEWLEKIVKMGSVIAAEGLLYCYGEDGVVKLIEPNAGGAKVRGQMKIDYGKDEHWAHPAIADKRFYIRHGDVLGVFDIDAPGPK